MAQRKVGLADGLGLAFVPALQALASVLTCCEMTAGVERAGGVEPLPFGIKNFCLLIRTNGGLSSE
jgi:hypothetical protein